MKALEGFSKYGWNIIRRRKGVQLEFLVVQNTMW